MKSFICSKCGKELANRHSLSRHKKSCKSGIRNVPERSPTYNLPTQPPPFPTFVAAAAVKDDSSCENRPKNPKILALLDEIVNDNPKSHVPPHEIHHVFLSYLQPRHHLCRRKIRCHRLHHHLYQRKCFSHHQNNRCYRNHLQKL